jgi:dTDP-glucose pyrophosphorylase
VFAYPVRDPECYGVVEFAPDGRVLSLEEKPERARQIQPSARGELEITDLNRQYLEEGLLQVELMGQAMAWLDTVPATRSTRRASTSAPWSTARGSRWAARRRRPGAWAGSAPTSSQPWGPDAG